MDTITVIDQTMLCSTFILLNRESQIEEKTVKRDSITYRCRPYPDMKEKFHKSLFYLSKAGHIRLLEPNWPLDNQPRNSQETLLSCAIEFKCLNPWLQNPHEAHGLCFSATDSFIELLLRRGVVTHAQIASGEVRKEEATHKLHAAVRYGGMIIDWTYRQYVSNGPAPYVYPLKPGEPLR